MTSGIYMLKFNNTDKVYIGQSINIEKRIQLHKYRLSKGEHTIKMMEAYNNYGMPEFAIIEECANNPKKLDALETFYIMLYDSVDNGFNVQEIPSAFHTHYKGEQVGTSKFSNTQIYNVLQELNKRPLKQYKDISTDTGVSITMIKNINYGVSHTWLKDKYPEEYNIMIKSGPRYTAMCTNKKYPSIISPDGTIYTNIISARAFATDNGLEVSSLRGLFSGRCKSHKGWKLAT